MTIPDSLKSIGDGVFNGCNSLTSVYYKGSAEQWAKIEIGDSNDELTTAEIVYGAN